MSALHKCRYDDARSMSDDRELRDALEAAQAKLKAAEAEAAQSRAKLVVHEQTKSQHEAELVSLRERVTTSERQLSELQRELNESQNRANAMEVLAKRRDGSFPVVPPASSDSSGEHSAGWIALLGFLVVVFSVWMLWTRGAETEAGGSALCGLALGFFCIAPWAFQKVFARD